MLITVKRNNKFEGGENIYRKIYNYKIIIILVYAYYYYF